MKNQKRKKGVCCCSKSSFDFLSSAKAKTYVEKSLQKLDRILLIRLRVLIALSLVFNVSLINSESYYVRKVKRLQENNFADVDLEFQNMILPSVEFIVIFGLVVELVILLLTFKWPKLARVVFPFDLFITFVFKLVPDYE